MRLASHLAAALLLAAPGLVRAQEVPFSTLARGNVGPFGPPAQRVVRSAQELRELGLARLVDPELLGTIAWGRDMVLACLQGTCSSGGYWIEIRDVRAEAGKLLVTWHAERPAPGAFVPAVRTAPYHLVLLRSAATVEFRSDSGDGATATTQEVEGRVQTFGAREVRLSSGGRSLVIVPPPQALHLSGFGGHSVRVRGVLGTGRDGEPQLEVQELLSPSPMTLQGIVAQSGEGQELLLGPPGVQPVRVRTWGHAADALRLGVGRDVRCETWVFSGRDGVPREARVDSVEATITESGNLLGVRRPDGRRPWVQEGERVRLLDVRRGDGSDHDMWDETRSYAKVETSAGRGFLRLEQLEVGTPPLLVVPDEIGGAPPHGAAAHGHPPRAKGFTESLGD